MVLSVSLQMAIPVLFFLSLSPFFPFPSAKRCNQIVTFPHWQGSQADGEGGTHEDCNQTFNRFIEQSQTRGYRHKMVLHFL